MQIKFNFIINLKINKAVVITASFNNLATLGVSKRKKRQILTGPSGGTIDTTVMEEEVKAFFETEGATGVTFTWNE